ncbi:MAG: ABC transporter ATP-binding protein [Puniceicoccaceae bacterium]
MPEASTPGDSGNPVILACRDICLGYPTQKGWKAVVHDVSFEVIAGQTVALVGESGSGKSTIAKALVKLIPVKSGSVFLEGEEVAPLDPAAFRPYRKTVQLVFQDPWQALNPRLNAGQLLAEPLLLHFPGLTKKDIRAKTEQLLKDVQLPTSIRSRYPSELSGGQRQRLLLARALAVEPDFLICDEPVSALDVSIQAQLLKLLQELKERRGLTLLFISHDLAVVQQVADRVMVLQEGRSVEWESVEELFANPTHPYTRMLIEACPKW